MFYLSVSKEVLNKAVEHANAIADRRVIGVLLGDMEENVLVVKEALPTEFRREDQGVKIPPESIAELAKLIADGKVEGNIVGWYHTHPGYGAFMSEIDVKTQQKLQQFSPYIVSLVLDPSSDDVKFFTFNDNGKRIEEIKGENLHLFEKNQNPFPNHFKKPQAGKTLSRYTPTAVGAKERPRPTLTPRQIYMMLGAVLLIVIIVGGLLIVLYLQGGVVVAPLSLPAIQHTPITKGVVGKEITLKAQVTGGYQGIKNVTVSYEWSIFEEGVTGEILTHEQAWKTVLMLLVATGGNEYAYTIPADEVQGTIDYYIRAIDQQDHAASTPIYTINIADFKLESSTDEIKLFLGGNQSATIPVRSIGDFQGPVKLSLSDTPYGIQAQVKPDTVTPPKGGAATATLTIAASPASGTFRGEFVLEVSGKAEKAEHSQEITVIVPTFEVTMSPTTIVLSKGDTASLTVKLSPTKDFDREIRFSITGLPSEVSWETTLKDNKVVIGQQTDLIVKITTTNKVQTGTYILTFVTEGGGIKDQQTITLTVK